MFFYPDHLISLFFRFITYNRVIFRATQTSFLFLIFLCSLQLLSQEQGYFTGKVIDQNTGESLVGASIFDFENPQQGITTNAEGRFSLQMPDDLHGYR